MEPSEETQAYLKREFARFLEEQHGNVNYDKAIEELIARDDRRLPIDLNLLRSFDSDLANGRERTELPAATIPHYHYIFSHSLGCIIH